MVRDGGAAVGVHARDDVDARVREELARHGVGREHALEEAFDVPTRHRLAGVLLRDDPELLRPFRIGADLDVVELTARRREDRFTRRAREDAAARRADGDEETREARARKGRAVRVANAPLRRRVREGEALLVEARLDAEPRFVVGRAVDLVSAAERIGPRAVARVLHDELLLLAGRAARVEREPLAELRCANVGRHLQDNDAILLGDGARRGDELRATPLEVGRNLHAEAGKTGTAGERHARSTHSTPLRAAEYHRALDPQGNRDGNASTVARPTTIYPPSASGEPGTLLTIASYDKGHDFMRSAKQCGWKVVLLTSKSLKDASGFPFDVLDEVFYMPDRDKKWDPQATLRAVSYLARSRVFDRIVPLDDFDLEMAAMLREHLRVPGMGDTTTRYFRDKLAMRVRAQTVGLRVPEFIHLLNDDKIACASPTRCPRRGS